MSSLQYGRCQSASLAILLVLSICACAPDFAQRSDENDPTAAGQEPRLVRVARALEADLDESFPSSLYVESDVRVSARTTGVIEKVLVDRGDRVKAGQELAVIEREVAARELEIAEQDARLAEAEFEQVKSLHKQNVVSPHEFLQSRIAFEQAVSKRELARAYLERCTVKAPFDGMVVERWAVLGQRVQEEDGEPLFRVVGRQPLRALVNVPESRLASLKVGGTADVQCLDEETPHEARIAFVSPAIDPASGTAPVIVETKHHGGALKVGSSVRVRFNGLDEGGGSRPLEIPREALAPGSFRPGATADLLVVDNGVAATRTVRVLETRGNAAYVQGSLAAGEPVILAGNGLAIGTPVRAREISR